MGRDRGAPPPAKPLRLFVAADVPDDVKADLAAFLEPFRDRVPGAGWTRRDGWHVTLRFLGSTWPRQVEAVRTAVEKAAAAISPFETSLTEVGAFPSERRARVLWVGLADEGELFQEIVTLLDDLLKLKDVVFRKYQRRRAAVEDLESIEKLLRQYAGND